MGKEKLIEEIVRLLFKNHCKNVISIDVAEKSDIADAFVVCSARNPNAGRAAYDDMTGALEAQGVFSARADGLKDGRWIVVDYGNVIVHIFHTQMRDLYQFEALWANEDRSNVKEYTEE